MPFAQNGIRPENPLELYRLHQKCDNFKGTPFWLVLATWITTRLFAMKRVFISRTNGGRLIAYCIIQDRTLVTIMVDKDYTRMGIATDLVPKYCNCVSGADPAAIRFYKKQGFKITDTVHERGQTAYIMTR